MGQNQPRSVYWRRRAFVVVLALAIPSLLVWGVNRAAGAGSHTSQVGRITSVSSRVTHHGGAPSGPPAHSPSPSTAPSAAPTRARPSLVSASTPAGLARACAAQQVVLSLVTSKGSYGRLDQPRFDVYVVSLGTQDCSFNVGPRYLSVVIKSGGITRIWSSADCVRGPGSDFVQLSTGVPSVLHFSWDRKASAPGCRLTRAAVRPGTYTATVTAPTAHLASLGTIFVLKGPGVAMP